MTFPLPYPLVTDQDLEGRDVLSAQAVQANLDALALGFPAITAGGPAGPVGPAGATGPPGAPGATGATGPVGPAGSGDLHFPYSQGVPSATWVVVHNLGKFAVPDVYDSAGSHIVQLDVTQDSINQLTLQFGGAFSGVCYCN